VRPEVGKLGSGFRYYDSSYVPFRLDSYRSSTCSAASEGAVGYLEG
jgi:hypothetical protein